MPQQLNQTIRTKFNKGLLTEFSELNFPDEASVDELNCTLLKAGNRTKRLGLKFEDNHEVVAAGEATSGQLFHTETWYNVSGDSSLEYLVVQNGGKIRFFRKGAFPFSSTAVKESNVSPTDYVLDLTAYNRPGGLGASSSRIDVSSIEGRLVVVSPQIDPIYIERDPDDGTFTVTEINVKIRDYEWQGDVNFYYNEKAIPSAGRRYDTKNAGWPQEWIDYYVNAQNAYPPLTHPYFSGKNSTGDFRVDEFQKIYAGTTLTANGHYILDLFNKQREVVSGVSDLGVEVISERFNTVAAYAGRVWYGGVGSKVYYSQIIEDIAFIGRCYAKNDPTAEYASDALATDGGYINIPEANGIKKVHVFGSSLLVFANNGVWRVSGVDGNLFQANDFSVYKVTNFGLAFRSSLVSGQNAVPFWWSYVGIHTIQVTEDGGMTEVNLSRDTIQSFWDDIGGPERSFVSSEYDAINNRILWLYPNQNEAVDYKLSNVLFLDVDLGAFYPWKISDAPDGRYVCGTSFFNSSGNEEVTFNVVDSNGDQVVDSLGNEVTVLRDVGTVRSSEVFFLTHTNDNGLTFSLFDGRDYLDWGSEDFPAYAESAYNFVGDLGRQKNTPYITVFMKQTETGFVPSGASYLAVDESSLKITAYWDFRKNASSPAQEIYRHKTPIIVDPNDLDTFPTPTTVLSTRLKVRGRGKVVRLRFEGQAGKGFNLLGWETLDAKNPSY